ncbi:MAG: hypothetical protein JWN72_681 [Thermoleophilia bacterium]|nr:hypothetical protein [Thermoleophilia bacterium]
MARPLKFGRTARNAASSAPAAETPWWEEISTNARTHGALPYVVEGFTEITEAVRRGHAVLVRREAAEVADGITVFDDGATPVTGPFQPLPKGEVAPIVAILRFDVGSARFVLQDAASPAGAVQLTPKRLATYLASPGREMGVALGA